MLLHCLLAYIISDKKSVVIQNIIVLDVTQWFSLVSRFKKKKKKSLFFSSLIMTKCHVMGMVFFGFILFGDSLSSLNLRTFVSFTGLGKVLDIIFSNIYKSLLFIRFQWHELDLLILPHRSLKALFIFYKHLALYSSGLEISIDLSMSSPTLLSTVIHILLLRPSKK